MIARYAVQLIENGMFCTDKSTTIDQLHYIRLNGSHSAFLLQNYLWYVATALAYNNRRRNRNE